MVPNRAKFLIGFIIGYHHLNPQQHCTKNEDFHKRFLRQIRPNAQETADLVTFTEEIFYGKLHFLCCARNNILFIYHRFLVSNALRWKYEIYYLKKRRFALLLAMQEFISGVFQVRFFPHFE